MRRPAFLAPAVLPFLLLPACLSYRTTEVRVLDQGGGGICDAVVEVTTQGSTAEGFQGKTRWTTDAAGRALLDRRDADSRHWRISAPGYRTLVVDASPEAIRLKQADGRLPSNAEAVPLVFRLERMDGVNDPKKFESKK